jgi:hypothetical protein
MTDKLAVALRDAATVAADSVVLAPASLVFREGRSRGHRRLAVAAAMATTVVAGVLAAAVLAPGRGPVQEELSPADGGGSGAGIYTVTVQIAADAPTVLESRLETCAAEAGASAGHARHTYTLTTSHQTDQFANCASKQEGVSAVKATRRDDQSSDEIAFTPRFTYERLPAAVPGSLRDTGIGNAQTWLEDGGLMLCWGQFEPFGSVCQSAASENARELNPPSESPGSWLIGGVVHTSAVRGTVHVLGRQLPAVVERYAEAPGLAIVVARWPGSQMPPGDFGSMSFHPA